MGGFKVICGNCGSDLVAEKSSYNKPFGEVKAKVIQRICLDCNNKSFVLLGTHK